MGVATGTGIGQAIQDIETKTSETGSALQGHIDELGRRSTSVPGAEAVQLRPKQAHLLRRGICPACGNMLSPLSKVCSLCSVNWSDEYHVAMRQKDSTTELLAEHEQQLQEPGPTKAFDEYVNESQEIRLKQAHTDYIKDLQGEQVPFTRQDLFHLHERICKDALDLMVRKNQDYAGGHSQDPFGNFRKSSMLGIDPVVGILLRVLDKFSRLESFIESGTLAVKDEPVDDIFRDVVNYMVLAAGLVEEQRRLSPKS